jgi:hypothetical protein
VDLTERKTDRARECLIQQKERDHLHDGPPGGMNSAVDMVSACLPEQRGPVFQLDLGAAFQQGAQDAKADVQQPRHLIRPFQKAAHGVKAASPVAVEHAFGDTGMGLAALLKRVANPR